MKRLLTTMLTLTCLSCFASDLTVKVNTDNTYTVGNKKTLGATSSVGKMEIDTKKFDSKERQRADRR